MLDWLRDHFDVSCDWPQLWGKWNWQTFRFIHASVEIDSLLGQFELDAALLGFGLRFVWVFDEDAEVRQSLSNMDWLADTRVCLSYADYESLKADADKWRGSQK